jgi:hypothetical protein
MNNNNNSLLSIFQKLFRIECRLFMFNQDLSILISISKFLMYSNNLHWNQFEKMIRKIELVNLQLRPIKESSRKLQLSMKYNTLIIIIMLLPFQNSAIFFALVFGFYNSLQIGKVWNSTLTLLERKNWLNSPHFHFPSLTSYFLNSTNERHCQTFYFSGVWLGMFFWKSSKSFCFVHSTVLSNEVVRCILFFHKYFLPQGPFNCRIYHRSQLLACPSSRTSS